jgi:hypothetical protein
LYPTFALRYDQPRIPYYPHLPEFKGIAHSDAYLVELERVIDEIEPVECHGHAAGQNYSDQIRQAVLADFWTEDLDYLRTKSVAADMWDDWSEALQRA